MDFQNKDKVDIILANPPFGAGEQSQVQENFPIKSGFQTSLLNFLPNFFSAHL